MRIFFLFSFCYAVFSIALALLVRDNASIALNYETTKLLARVVKFVLYLKFAGIPLLILLYVSRQQNWKVKAANTAYAFFGSLMFCAAFSITKTSIPYVVPFYADPLLADVDKFLHFGIDPWEITHRVSANITPAMVEVVYVKMWALPAFFLPVLIALTDGDKPRSHRYLVLYCVCWILLGNILALGFSSVGPVYYDLLFDDSRFAGLTRALNDTGISESILGQVQALLWNDYISNSQNFATGISAFPSLHVGMATVIALYMTERSAFLFLPGFAFLLAVLFCSVYIGFHYAIDGYASIGVILVVWALQRRRTLPIGAFAPA